MTDRLKTYLIYLYSVYICTKNVGAWNYFATYILTVLLIPRDQDMERSDRAGYYLPMNRQNKIHGYHLKRDT